MKRKKPSKSSPSFDNPEIEQIEQLFQFMTEHNLEEFEYSRGDLKIRLRKPSAGVAVSVPRNVAEAEILLPRSMEGAPKRSVNPRVAADQARATAELHLGKASI